jgi:peptide/nickel transport system permease protein
MRLTDAGLSFPPIVLALAVVAVLGTSITDLALALAFVFAPGFARYVRGQTLAIKEESFVEASTAVGSPPLRIVVTRVLPNVMTGLIVQIAIALGAALLAESSLAFLGLGPAPPAASWGAMLREAYDTTLFTHPWSLVPAGATIALTVLAFNTIGDGLRDTIAGTVVRTARVKGQARTKGQRGLTTVTPSAPRPRPEAAAPPSERALLEIRGLSIDYDTDAGPVSVVDDLSFDVPRRTIVGLVGESGCGKTVSTLAVLRLLDSPPARIVGGSVRFDGIELLDLDFAAMRQIRGRDISMVFQDPLASLDPAFTVESQLVEAIRLHDKVSRHAARERAVALLEQVHIPDPSNRMSAYPHQLSGGMRQRVMLAIALACHPRLLLADEPTTALDVTVQAQIVELLQELRDAEDLAVLFVTHDLALLSEFADAIVVMYAGQLVERANRHDLFSQPRHPYTAALLGSMPGAKREAAAAGLIGGQVPQAGHYPGGCRFHPRCAFAEDRCVSANVEVSPLGEGRETRCVRHDELILPGGSGVSGAELPAGPRRGG